MAILCWAAKNSLRGTGASISTKLCSLYMTLDPPYVVRLFQHRWVHCTGPSLCGASISAQVGSLYRTPPYVVRLFQHWWVHCTGPSLCGASISAQVGSLHRTLLMQWVYFSIGGFIVQDLHMWCVYFSIGGFIVQDPFHLELLFQHRWVNCTGPS